MSLDTLRRDYHQALCAQILYVDANDAPNFADKHSRPSVALAQGIVKKLPYPHCPTPLSGQTVGSNFESITRNFLAQAFRLLEHLRPGKWQFFVHADITHFDQYEHLTDLTEVLKQRKDLRAALGDYLISPDIVVGRAPVTDEEINQQTTVIQGQQISSLTPLRAVNSSAPKQILHASISCKWTFRSDRSQNARTEGLNLIRNRKGHTPHIAIVTAESYPQRLASVALGTGDIDCVYHIALPDLQETVKEYDNPAVTDMLDTLIEGRRLRDISDLPFDLIT